MAELFISFLSHLSFSFTYHTFCFFVGSNPPSHSFRRIFSSLFAFSSLFSMAPSPRLFLSECRCRSQRLSPSLPVSNLPPMPLNTPIPDSRGDKQTLTPDHQSPPKPLKISHSPRTSQRYGRRASSRGGSRCLQPRSRQGTARKGKSLAPGFPAFRKYDFLLVPPDVQRSNDILLSVRSDSHQSNAWSICNDLLTAPESTPAAKLFAAQTFRTKVNSKRHTSTSTSSDRAHRRSLLLSFLHIDHV